MDLLSKKDLLAITGISYGQLYRWKRERLIPEEWFIKQSSYTGQETFFPKEKIIERVTAIVNFKDKYSLPEIADIFSSENKLTIPKKEIGELDEINRAIINVIDDFLVDNEFFTISQAAFLMGISKTAANKNLSDEQLLSLTKNGLPIVSEIKNQDISFIVFKTEDNFHIIFLKDTKNIMFDKTAEIIDTASLNDIMEKIKINLAGGHNFERK